MADQEQSKIMVDLDIRVYNTLVVAANIIRANGLAKRKKNFIIKVSGVPHKAYYSIQGAIEKAVVDFNADEKFSDAQLEKIRVRYLNSMCMRQVKAINKRREIVPYIVLCYLRDVVACEHPQKYKRDIIRRFNNKAQTKKSDVVNMLLKAVAKLREEMRRAA